MSKMNCPILWFRSFPGDAVFMVPAK